MGNQQIRAWSMGLDMAYAAGGMLLLGAGIDWLAGTKPWWMLSLGLLGLVVGMYRFIRDAVRMNSASAPRRAGTGGSRKPPTGPPTGPSASPPTSPPTDPPA
jgi:F0F1-type ATP synthase assembly protein I